jgi:hypothetical protein
MSTDSSQKVEAAKAEAVTMPWEKGVLEELIRLLGDPSPAVRGGALSHVASFSGTIEGRAALAQTDVVRVLVRLIGDVNQAYVKDSMAALINLAEVSVLATQMVERNVVSRALDIVLDSSDSQMMPLYLMLLSNVTRFPAGARKLLNLDDDASLKGYYVAKLLPKFLQEYKPSTANPASSSDNSDVGTDRNAWLGGLLVNASTLEEGRLIFANQEKGLLKQLMPQLSHKNPLRRRAALGIMRNCLFDPKEHEWVLNASDLDFLTSLLILIRTAEPFENPDDTIGMDERLKTPSPSQKLEEDIECKKLIVDILTLLTATRFGRDLLKTKKAYPIVREFDRLENNEVISSKLYELVHVLLLDDPEDEEANEQAKIDAEQAQQASSSAPPKPAPKDIDEYGEEIEEL